MPQVMQPGWPPHVEVDNLPEFPTGCMQLLLHPQTILLPKKRWSAYWGQMFGFSKHAQNKS